MTPKPAACKGCPMHDIGEGFIPLDIRGGNVMMVGEAPKEEDVRASKCFAGGEGVWLRNLCRKAGLKYEDITFTNTILCRPPNNIYPTDPKATYLPREKSIDAVAHCAKQHLWPSVTKANKSKLYAIGNRALEALTGKSGIHTWRGSILPLRTGGVPKVVPTHHPGFLMRSAKLTSVVGRDLKRPFVLPPENYKLFPSIEDLRRFNAKTFAFDFEWDRDGNITLCGLSDRYYSALVVPFIPPFIDELRRIFEGATHLIGHNIVNADLPFIERMGWDLSKAEIEDTMLKQHLVQPDLPHGLDFVASVFTNKNFWKGKWENEEELEEGEAPSQQWRTWDREDALPRQFGGYGGCYSDKEAFALYNARDTDAEFQINTPLQHMLDKFDLDPLYRNVSRPAAYICRWLGDRGLRLDTTRLGEIRQTLDTTIADLEEKLPDGLRPYEKTVGCNLVAPPDTYRSKTKTCKGGKKYGGPHQVYEHVFERPGEVLCPECGKPIVSGKLSLAKIVKGTRQELVTPYNSPEQLKQYVKNLNLKTVYDHKTGRETTGKKARTKWGKAHPEFAVLGELKKSITLRNNFAKSSLVGSADLGLPPQERMYFNLKVHGTGEGRLSSTGRRRGIDLNIQNQPEAFRVIYVPEQEDWGFINIDISQGESWLTCWLAKDWARWEKLQSPDYDEHSELAQAIFNCPVSKDLCKKDKALNALRQIGKKTNHASSYGMGYKKFYDVLTTEGIELYTPSDCKEFLETWRRLNPGTVRWQKETIEIAQRQGFLRNPFGRVRWFQSQQFANQALAFLPASTLADMVLRMMICHYPHEFYDSIVANGQRVFHPLVEGWIMSIQVHDSLVMQGPWISKDEQERRSIEIMTQPFPQLDGFQFRVDVKSSQRSWGDC